MSEAQNLTAVAMSGGLDSSVTAWLLAREPAPVVGLSMLLWDRSGERRHGRCCSALDLGDAKRVAQQAGIPHYTLRMDREFQEKVVDPFVDDYLSGKTPIPCVACNTWLKFDLLLDRAKSFGADKIATGHYARIVPGEHGLELPVRERLDEAGAEELLPESIHRHTRRQGVFRADEPLGHAEPVAADELAGAIER